MAESAEAGGQHGDVGSGLPIAVALDGALLRTDILFECIAMSLRRPWVLVASIFSRGRGRSIRHELEQRAVLDVSLLPVNDPLADWLRRQREHGRKLSLYSISDDTTVQRIARRFDLFDHAQGGNVDPPSGRSARYDAIALQCGERFSYAADGRGDDVDTWKRCGNAIVVGPPALRALVPAEVRVEHEIAPTTGGRLRAWAKALRLHQWAKNALLLIPLLLSGNLQSEPVLAALLGFVAFGLIASANYLVNDLMDLASDRMHPTKQRRPFASGALPISGGLIAVPLLALGAICILTLLPSRFIAVAAAYVVVTALYSARLKQAPVVDLFILALLYTMRLMAGMAAIDAPFSPWLLAFSMFFFCSIAAIKRHVEVEVLAREGHKQLAGRGYRSTDGAFLMALGLASGLCSALVFFIYLVDPNSPARGFARPELMSFICVILAYWLGRAWLITTRGEMHDDPVQFALRDRVSLSLGAVVVVLVIAARWS